MYIVAPKAAGMGIMDGDRLAAGRYNCLNEAMNAARLLRADLAAREPRAPTSILPVSSVVIGVDNGSSIPGTPEYWDGTKADQTLVKKIRATPHISFGL